LPSFRQTERELRSATFFTFNTYLSAVSFDYVSCYRQTQTGAVLFNFSCVSRPEEILEDVPDLIGRYPDPTGNVRTKSTKNRRGSAFVDSRAKLTSQCSNRLPTNMKKRKLGQALYYLGDFFPLFGLIELHGLVAGPP